MITGNGSVVWASVAERPIALPPTRERTMASQDPFYISKSLIVAPIACLGCGHNMYCFRRQLVETGERQSFLCSGCGHEIARTVGPEASDSEIQALVERTVGLASRSAKKPGRV